jgi:hypothetical protein
MDFQLEEHELFRRSVAEFVDKEVVSERQVGL